MCVWRVSLLAGIDNGTLPNPGGIAARCNANNSPPNDVKLSYNYAITLQFKWYDLGTRIMIFKKK